MNREEAAMFFKFLGHKGLTEIRVVDPNNGLKRQIFVDSVEDFVKACEEFDGKFNVYAGVNPRASRGGKAENVSALLVIPIDIDPTRPKGVASTEGELELARQKVQEIKAWLKEKFGCDPFVAMSGNGFHIYIKIHPIPLDEFNRHVVQDKLKQFNNEIQEKFNNDEVHIDSTFDLPRVMKVPGTLSVKGDNTKERPWRRCRIVEAQNEPCAKVRSYLASLQTPKGAITELQLGERAEEDFDSLLQKDPKLKNLFEGRWQKHDFPTRSEAEQSLLTKLVLYGFSKDAIHSIMSQSKIGKWQEKSDAYRRTSIAKATEFAEAHKRNEKKSKMQKSCGEALPDKIFEQADGEFIVFDKASQKITKRKTVEGFEPFDKLVWTPVDDALPYESERQLWSEVKQYIWDHVDISEGYDILTAWALASWVPERWHAVPYLFFYGPAGSGKTWALEVLASIGFRPFLTAATTLAAIFRVVDEWHPTSFLDETEAYMRKDRSEITHLLNAGYRKGFPATRVEDTKDGFKVRIFDCFGFKALAGTREFARTLKSRCIIFTMSKATRKIKTTINNERARQLQRKLLMYRFNMLSKEEKMKRPDVLTGRLRELFDPLIIVAPAEAKHPIIAQATQIKEMTEEEERTSDEAMIFKTVHDIHEATHQRKITIEEIAKLVNENLGFYEEQMSNIAIGMALSRLGFKRTLHNGKRAIFWNKEIAERLVRRYLTAPQTGGLTAFSGEDTEST